jgi:hypothetical protein
MNKQYLSLPDRKWLYIAQSKEKLSGIKRSGRHHAAMHKVIHRFGGKSLETRG